MHNLASKVLLVDEVPDENIARYEVSKSIALVFNPINNNIFKTSGDEILVPMTTNDVNWDYKLIKMLIESVDESDSSRNIYAKSLGDHYAWLDVDSYFADLNIICGQVVVHPSRSEEMISLAVHESELCPQNKAFFLASPHFLGVLATRKNKQEFGISVINSEFIVCVNFEK